MFMEKLWKRGEVGFSLALTKRFSLREKLYPITNWRRTKAEKLEGQLQVN